MWSKARSERPLRCGLGGGGRAKVANQGPVPNRLSPPPLFCLFCLFCLAGGHSRRPSAWVSVSGGVLRMSWIGNHFPCITIKRLLSLPNQSVLTQLAGRFLCRKEVCANARFARGLGPRIPAGTASSVVTKLGPCVGLVGLTNHMVAGSNPGRSLGARVDPYFCKGTTIHPTSGLKPEPSRNARAGWRVLTNLRVVSS